jgi:hypothetical protein
VLNIISSCKKPVKKNPSLEKFVPIFIGDVLLKLLLGFSKSLFVVVESCVP